MNPTKRNPVRVSREHRCPVCNHDSWCLIGDAYVVCMRVLSDKPKTLNGGETGYLHPIGNRVLPIINKRPTEPERPRLNVELLLDTWRRNRASNSTLVPLASNLGLSTESLNSMDCVKAPYHETWAFPMRYGDGGYCGIRLRRLNGDKWAERGSHSGLFIPSTRPNRLALIVEGPTDAAAAVHLGYWPIGRPSCSGGVDQLKIAVRHYGINRAVIVADLDDPGLRGAKTLQEHLPISTAILVFPAKDIRSFVNKGGDGPMVEALISTLIWSVK